jgi:hypothetical protein
MGQIVSFEGYTPPARFDSVPWSQALIQEAPADIGPWTLIDTINLLPADTDPADPQTRSFTTTNGTAPALWYRVVFADANAGQSNPTDPVRNDNSGPPTLFATADDLADRIGVDLTADERIRANVLLELASGLVQDEAKKKIGRVDDDLLEIPGTTDDMIRLPELPVISVASLTLDGVPLIEGSDWYLDGGSIARIPAATTVLTGGLIDEAFSFPLGTGFGWPAQTIAITYTHGYDAANIPKSVKAIILEAVVRVWVNPGSVARETVGDTATVYDNMRFSPTGLLLTDDEKKIIRRLFGRTAKSISIGR